ICTLRSNGPEGGGQDARRNCQASNKAEGHPSGWPFCVAADPRPVALRLPGLQTAPVPRRPGKQRAARRGNEPDVLRFMPR
ncbi:hypothetical protein, partial [Pseudescherichia sp.]|uniref:hypothetical protein n=1 Tax=Pseudescherichia sp. TaxID=2055881 RepID=UPI0028A623B4